MLFPNLGLRELHQPVCLSVLGSGTVYELVQMGVITVGKHKMLIWYLIIGIVTKTVHITVWLKMVAKPSKKCV